MFQHGHVFSCSCLSMFMFMFHGSNMLHHVHACCDIECSMPGCHWPHMTNLCFALPGTKTCLSGWKLPCICWRKKMFDSSLEVLGDRTGQKGLSLGFSCFGRFLIRKCPSREGDFVSSVGFDQERKLIWKPNKGSLVTIHLQSYTQRSWTILQSVKHICS